MAKVQSPYQKAKSVCTRRGSSVDDLKFQLRKQFKSRLRDMRSQSIDSCRDLADEVNEGYRDLATTLESQLDKFALVQPDDVLKTLKEIHSEMLEQIANEEVTDYESFVHDEVEAIVENLITCKVCEQFSEKDICDRCSTKHFAD